MRTLTPAVKQVAHSIISAKLDIPGDIVLTLGLDVIENARGLIVKHGAGKQIRDEILAGSMRTAV